MALTLSIQPNEHGIHGSRSPIVYQFTGADQSYSYQFDLALTTGAISSLANYVSINRVPDIDNYITIDASTLIKNFLMNNISYTTENVAYFQATMYEFNTGSTGSTVSEIGIATLGYTKYTDGMNFTDETTAKDYIMNYLYTNKIYPIFNYTGTTTICWRDAGVNTGYKINFTTTSGSAGNTQASFPTQSVAKDEIARISFIYNELNYDMP